jgi:hypothetical protein
VADGIVNGEAVGDVAARAVDEQRDRLAVVVRHVAKAFDARPRRVFFDVADQVHVAEPVAGFLAQLRSDRVYQLGYQAVAQVTHGRQLSHQAGMK